LPVPGGPTSNMPFGDMCAQLSVFGGVPEELYDLLELGLGLVHTGHVGEADAGFFFHVNLGLAAADLHEPAETLFVGELAEQQHPDSEEDKRWRHPGNQRAEKGVLRNARDLDAGAVDPLQDRGIHDRGHELALAVDGVGEGAGDGVRADRDRRDPAILEIALELAVADRCDGLPAGDQVLDEKHGYESHHPVPDVVFGLPFHAACPFHWRPRRALIPPTRHAQAGNVQMQRGRA